MRGIDTFLHYVSLGGPDASLMMRIALNLIDGREASPVDISELLTLEDENRAMLSAFLMACRVDGEPAEPLKLAGWSLDAVETLRRRYRKHLEQQEVLRRAGRCSIKVAATFFSNRNH